MLLPGLMCYMVMKPSQSTPELEEKLPPALKRAIATKKAEYEEIMFRPHVPAGDANLECDLFKDKGTQTYCLFSKY